MKNLTLKKSSSDLKFVYSDNDSISIIFQNNDLLMGVVGEFNSNLQELEKITNTNLYFRAAKRIQRFYKKKKYLCGSLKHLAGRYYEKTL